MRHAIAEERDATRWPVDALRPLTADGAERFRRAARGLRRIVPAVELVLASPYARAWQTGELLHEEAGWPLPEQCPELAAHRTAADALDTLARHVTRESVVLVGHEPNLSLLASLLLAGDASAVPVEFKKGGVMALVVPGAPAPGSALLSWSATPKLLRALRAG